jgi:hypothetical protein
MQPLSQDDRDKMGDLHNKFVELIDGTQLNYMEVLTVLEMVVGRLRQLLPIEMQRK